jgi:hypothetical protein
MDPGTKKVALISSSKVSFSANCALSSDKQEASDPGGVSESGTIENADQQNSNEHTDQLSSEGLALVLVAPSRNRFSVTAPDFSLFSFISRIARSRINIWRLRRT